MYQRIQSNVRKTWLLILIFVLITVAMGFVFGYMTDTGPIGPVSVMYPNTKPMATVIKTKMKISNHVLRTLD